MKRFRTYKSDDGKTLDFVKDFETFKEAHNSVFDYKGNPYFRILDSFLPKEFRKIVWGTVYIENSIIGTADLYLKHN